MALQSPLVYKNKIKINHVKLHHDFFSKAYRIYYQIRDLLNICRRLYVHFLIKKSIQ